MIDAQPAQTYGGGEIAFANNIGDEGIEPLITSVGRHHRGLADLDGHTTQERTLLRGNFASDDTQALPLHRRKHPELRALPELQQLPNVRSLRAWAAIARSAWALGAPNLVLIDRSRFTGGR